VRNQPKYHFFKNTLYAISGIFDIVKNETSFKIELFICFILINYLVFTDIDLSYKLIMFVTLMGMLLAEIINSAIERVVDLVTLEYHDMAKRAKDAGSAIVFASIIIFLVTWISILLEYYY
jgi:diacylglycerol kinase (ATP)